MKYGDVLERELRQQMWGFFSDSVVERAVDAALEEHRKHLGSYDWEYATACIIRAALNEIKQ